MNRNQFLAQLQFDGATIIDRQGNTASRTDVIALLQKHASLTISEIGRRTFFVAHQEALSQTFGFDESYIVLLPLESELQSAQPLSA